MIGQRLEWFATAEAAEAYVVIGHAGSDLTGTGNNSERESRVGSNQLRHAEKTPVIHPSG